MIIEGIVQSPGSVVRHDDTRVHNIYRLQLQRTGEGRVFVIQSGERELEPRPSTNSIDCIGLTTSCVDLHLRHRPQHGQTMHLRTTPQAKPFASSGEM